MMARTRCVFLATALPIVGCGGPRSTTPSDAGPPASLAPTPELKAAMEFASAQVAERSRQTRQAIDGYRKVATEYPETPQAGLARSRLAALKAR